MTRSVGNARPLAEPSVQITLRLNESEWRYVAAVFRREAEALERTPEGSPPEGMTAEEGRRMAAGLLYCLRKMAAKDIA